MSTIIQRAFSGGEISPSLRFRVDTAKYQTGLATLRNFIVQRYGGASNRPGSKFVCETKDSTRKVKLIPFVFNADQSYVLEFGHLYMRVIKAGQLVTDVNNPITNITKATQAVVTSSPHGLTDGKYVTIKGLVGMGDINNRTFIVSDSTPTTYKIKTLDGSYVNSTNFETYISGGAGYRVFELETKYVEADLPLIQYIQSADVVTLTHQNYPPARLSRIGDVYWTIDDYPFQPTVIDYITAEPVLTAGAAGSVRSVYAFTPVAPETGEEGLLYYNKISNIQISAMTPGTTTTIVTSSPHGFNTGDIVFFRKTFTAVYEPKIDGKRGTVTVVNSTTFTIDIDTTGATTSGGAYNIFRIGYALNSAAPTTTAPNRIKFPTDLNQYAGFNSAINVYKYDTNDFYFLGTLQNNGGTTFLDQGLSVVKSQTPPVPRNPFVGDGNYPAACAYIQQRLVFANTRLNPEKVWTSRTGNFGNFTVSTPSQDDQAITFTMAGKQVNAVRYLLDVGQFVILTSGGEWLIQGENGVLTPTGINPKQSSYNGSAEGLQPIIIDNTAVYTQARGSIVRDLAFNFQSDGYTGNDLTVFASHLFDKFVLKDWAYQQVPQSILWIVRDDGTLLGLTYVKDQQILAWHRHDTDGTFENVCSIPEGNEDVLYAVVRRSVNGRAMRNLERFSTRKVLDIRDSKFMDSHVTIDGRNLIALRTMTLTGSGWTYEDALTLTCSQSYFVATDVGKTIQLFDASGGVIRFTVTAFTSATVVTGYPDRTVPVTLRALAATSWAKAVKEIRGLWHLEGKAVSVFADGNVVSSPNNSGYETLTVTNGVVTLDKAYAVIHIGVPYVSDLETLNVDFPQSETLVDKQKLVTQVTVAVEETRGGFIGAMTPPLSDPTLNLVEFKPRSDEPYDSPASLVTGRFKQPIAGLWNSTGKIFLRQVDPLPMSILAIAPRLMRG